MASGPRCLLRLCSPPTPVPVPFPSRVPFTSVGARHAALGFRGSFPWGICMAVPVFAKSGQLVASLSVSGSPTTLEEKERGEVLPELMRTASRIQQRLA